MSDTQPQPARLSIIRLGPDDPLGPAADVPGERVLILDPSLTLDDSSLAAHKTTGVAVGGAEWPADRALSTLAAHLDDGDALLGARRVRPGDRVFLESFRHVSLPRSALRVDAALPPRWQRIAAWRALLIDGLRPRRVAASATWTTAPTGEAQHLDRLRDFAEGARAAYDIDPELLPRVTRRFGPMLPPARGPAPMARLAAFDLLGRSTAGTIDSALLDRLEDRLLFDALARALSEQPAADDFLPLAYVAAMSKRRENPRAAAEALTALAPRSPLVCGGRAIQVLIEAGEYRAAREQADALLREARAAPFARAHLLAGEVALIVGQLDRAESHFDGAYHASERPIETAAHAAALLRRYGPAPAARSHLERIIDDAEGRSALDYRTLVAPAIERLAELP